MRVSLIVAVGKNRAIGKDNDLIWDLPKDMAFFKKSTQGHTIITGRKNYESIPEKYRPLKGRENLVITRQKDYESYGAKVFHSLKDAIQHAEESNCEELYIIGGGQIYKESIEQDLVDRMLITWIDESFDADVFFPEFDEGQWNKQQLAYFTPDEKHKYAFEMIEYTKG